VHNCYKKNLTLTCSDMFTCAYCGILYLTAKYVDISHNSVNWHLSFSCAKSILIIYIFAMYLMNLCDVVVFRSFLMPCLPEKTDAEWCFDFILHSLLFRLFKCLQRYRFAVAHIIKKWHWCIKLRIMINSLVQLCVVYCMEIDSYPLLQTGSLFFWA